MTTQPVECDASAASWGAEVWAVADSANSIKRAGANSDLLRMNADERGLCGDDKDDFDLLMENASHFRRILGIRICAAGGDGCSVGTQLLWPRTEVRKRAAIPSQLLSGLRPTGGR